MSQLHFGAEPVIKQKMTFNNFRINFILLVIVLAMGATAGVKTEFKGYPKIKVSEGGVDRKPDTLIEKDAADFRCVISQIDGKYYWATRDNKELYKISLGGFITYTAVDGSGYIRVIKPEMKKAAALMGKTESEFDYVEHLLIGLRSITYFGIQFHD
jgi:hypothetical protein